MEKLEELFKIINESQRIVFFGGAGVSTASNIPDFRGANGLYNYSPEEIISHSFFMSNPNKFFEFYFSKMVYKDAMPNECHYFLAELEKRGKLSAVVTQNIDGLHQKAGSKHVLELHGSVLRNHCMKCHQFYSLDDINCTGIPKCHCGGVIKPDVVLYEEPLDNMVVREAIFEISHADTLIVAGTSLVVYPAADFIDFFQGKNLVIINLGNTNYDKKADLVINGRVEEYLNRKYLK